MITKNLKSKDANLRREAVEYYLYDSIDDESLKDLAAMMEDPDKGVRNSLNILFSTSDNPKIPDEIIGYVSSEDISVRNMAGDILLKIGDTAVDTLVNYIDKGNDDDKKFCIDILGLIGSKRAEKKIIATINKNEDDNVILACLEAFGNIKSEASIGKLKEFFYSKEIFKPTIIEALGKIGNTEVLEFLYSVYYIQDVLTKYSIIESLGLVGNSGSLKLLVSELRSNNGALIGAIILSIFQIKEKYNLDILIDDELMANISGHLLSLESNYLNAAISLIHASIKTETIEDLVKVYGTDGETDEMIKASFMDNFNESLKKILNYIKLEPKNTLELLTFLKESYLLNPELFSEVNNENITDSFSETLLALLGHDNEEIRGVAQELLISVDVNKALEYGESVIDDDCVWNRLNFVEQLAKIEDSRAEELLTILAGDEEEMVKERAHSLIKLKLSE